MAEGDGRSVTSMPPAPRLQRLRQSVLVHAPAAEVYEALLDSTTLSRVFGRPVQASSVRRGEFRLFDRIHGANAELEGPTKSGRPGRIVQSFRYAMPEWPLEHFSKLTIQLRPVPDGTRVILDQSSIPAGCAQRVVEHWQDHVWPGLKSILENRVRATDPPKSVVGRRLVRNVGR